MSKVGFYIHIPFCARKCGYCDFYSHKSDASARKRYLSALALQLRVSGNEADTVFFGGGTPSLLEPEEISALLLEIKRTPDCEVTIEANPETLTPEKLTLFRRAGVNRLSIGLESAVPRELDALGRGHGTEVFLRAFAAARGAGFENINVDIMYGIPHQSAASLSETLGLVFSLSPEHISAYCLKIEEGTPYFRAGKALLIPGADECADMYLKICRECSERGYGHYEISNFARDGFESRHNLKYWNCEEYEGFGAAAHSYLSGERYYFAPDSEKFSASLLSGASPEKLGLCPGGDENEYIMLRMRLSRGVCVDDFGRKYGSFEKFAEKFRKYGSEYVVNDGKNVFFTNEGMLVSNTILSEVLDFA